MFPRAIAQDFRKPASRTFTPVVFVIRFGRAIEIQPEYRDAIGDERDFDPLRADPDFQALTTIIV
ncbi:MAG: hypothetical protein JSS27_08900 [Planctomycetes bacterium]|nr:hypothetical protein [Planctomycetota bacterium]